MPLCVEIKYLKMKKIYTFFALMLMTLATFCQTSLPIACYFDATNTLPNGWTFVAADADSYNNDLAGIAPLELYGSAVTPYSTPNVFCFASQMPASDYNQYLISPRISNPTEDSVQLRLMYAAEDCWGNVESFRIGYCTTDTYDLGQVIWSTADIQTSITSWQSLIINMPANAQYIVINYDVTDMQCALYIDNVLIRADVEGLTYPVTINANAGGTVTPGTTAVTEADDFTFTATADEGYRIESILLDGNALTAAAGTTSFTYTIQNIMTPHQVDVTFALKQSSIYVTVGAHGSVVPDGGSTHNVLVPWNTDATFHFYPDEGYHVNDVIVDYGWHGGSITEYTFPNVVANHAINVTFALNHYTITASAGANGTISPAGTISAMQGDNTSFNITPNTGYLIDTLYIDAEPYMGFTATGFTYTFHNVSADHTIHAVFAPQQFLVVSLPAVGGSTSLTGGTSISADSTMVAYNQTVTAAFEAGEGYTLSGVVVNGEDVTPYTNPMTLTITGPTTIQPVFQVQTYSITVTRYGTGTISPLAVNDIGYFDESVFTFTPNYCAQIDSILLDGVHQPLTSELHLSHLSGNHNLSVYFSNMRYAMSISEVEHGTITTTTPEVVCGATAVFDLNPDPCYQATHFYVDGVQHDEFLAYANGHRIARLTNIESSHEISASFEIVDYQIVVNKNGEGSVSHEGTTPIACGGNMEIIMAPAECYRISVMHINNEELTDVTWRPASRPGFADTAILHLDDISQDFHIDVTFSPINYTVSTHALSNGTIMPNGTSDVTCGSNQDVVITPNTCYQIDKIFVDGELATTGIVWNGDIATYTFTDIRANHEIRAEFVLKQHTMHIEVAGSGNASPLGDSIVECGASFRFDAIPQQCHKVDSVFIDGVLSNNLMTASTNEDPMFGDSLSYVFNEVTSSHDIRIVFAPIQYTFAASGFGNGNITSNVTDGIIHCGEEVQLTLTPDDCHYIEVIYYNGDEFTDYQLDENGVGHIVFTNIQEDIALGAIFSPISYQTNVIQPQHGTIQYQPSNWNCGDDVTIDITKESCYHLDTLFINDQVILPEALTIQDEHYQYALENVREDLQISAAITTDMVHVVSTVGAPLSFSDTTLVCGSSLRVSAEMSTCQQIDSIRWNGNVYEGTALGNIGQISRIDDTLILQIHSIVENSDLAIFLSNIQYQLAVHTHGSGSVSHMGVQTFSCGDSIAITITPAPCNRLSQVLLNGSPATLTDDTLLIINSLQNNIDLYVDFTPISYEVVTHSTTFGRIDGETGNLACGRLLKYDFLANDCAHLDSVFVNGECVNTQLDTIDDRIQYIIPALDEAYDISAVFSRDIYEISVSADAHMSINVATQNDVLCGEAFEFTITPEECYTITDILLDGTSILSDMNWNGRSALGKIMDVRANHQLVATTSQNIISLTKNLFFNGELFEHMDSHLTCGSDTIINIDFPDCWVLDSVNIGGERVRKQEYYELTNLTEEVTMNIFMSTAFYTVEYQDMGHCTPIHNMIDTVVCGENYVVKADAEAGYIISGWTVNGMPVPNEYEITNIHDNYVARPILQHLTYTIYTSVAEGNGTIQPETATVDYGSDITINFIPGECQHVERVQIDGRILEGIDHYTFLEVEEDHTVHVSFAQNMDTIFMNVGPHGSVTGNGVPTSGVNLVPCGENYQLAIKPEACYDLASIFVDNVLSNRSLIHAGNFYYLTLSSVDTNHQIRVTFEPIRYNYSATCNYGGTISPMSALPICGSNYSFHIEPLECYEIDSVWIDGVYTSLENFTEEDNIYTYTFVDYHANHQVNVRFRGQVFQFDILNDGESQVLVEQIGNDCAGDIHFTIVPDICENINNVYVNNTDITRHLVHHPNTDPNLADSLSYTITQITSDNLLTIRTSQVSDRHISLLFEADGETLMQYDSAVSCNGNLMIPVEYDCYLVESIEVNGTQLPLVYPLDEPFDYEFRNVTGDSSIHANFTLKTYSITATAGQGGQISPNGSTTVSCGNDQSFAITADDGYSIDSVFVNGTFIGTGDSYTFENVHANGDIRVVFSQNHYTVTVSAGNGGQVSPETSDVVYGQRVTIDITPDDCYSIASVIVNGVNVGAVSSYTFENVRGDSTLQATFMMNEYTITATAGAGGQISPNGSTIVSCGNDQSYVITADDGYAIDSVIVNGTSVGAVNSYTFENVHENADIRVVFSQNHYTVTASAGNGGQVSPETSDVVYGQRVTIDITPDDCYSIASVIVNGVNVGAVSSYTFDNVRGDSTLQAIFVHNNYDIGIVVYLEGEYVLGDSISVPCGGDTLYEIPLFSCYSIDSILVDGESVPVVDSLFIANVREDMSVDVFVSRTMYNVIITKQGNGTVTPMDTVAVACDDDLTITMIADTGWFVSEILIDGTSMGTPTSSTYTLAHLHADAQVEVIFAINEYIINSSVEPINAGQINPYGNHIVSYGESVTYHITAFPNYEIRDVEVDGVSVGNSDSYTFDFVDNNHTIIAYFETVGIEDVESGELRVYASGRTIALINTTTAAVKMVQIFDVQGREVAQFGAVEDGFRTDLSVAPGTYFVRVATNKGTESFKVVLY